MGNPLRILHVVVNMNRGGAETLIMNLYRNMDRSKVQFDFLTCKKGVFDSEIVAMGGKIHRIPYITEVGHSGYIKELDKFLLTNKSYQIVHAHMDKMSGFVLRSARKANIPIRIAHSHNTRSEGGFATKIYKWYAGNNIKPNATHFYACSHAAAKWLYGESTLGTFILKNGIVTDKFQYAASTREQIRKELKIDKDTLILGHVGRFSHQKNHLFLLDIFKRVNKKLPNSQLLLVGDGSLRNKIIEKINYLNLEDNVQLLGVREDVDGILQAFDLFIFPSLHEGLPVTLIEAQGTGLPCLISNTITEEVDMGVGMVHALPLTDRTIWTEKIIKLAKLDRSRIIARDALSEKGYDIRKTAGLAQTSYLTLGGKVI
ncbi:glycosyltransferase family 1 protein [Virgibacillus necropolis]|uniref:Glycosyl transferase family 1 n=1 Tax=Virgibacillus necropolis TaxID=163877 RepID=A0A221MEH4_9BACI|nr:glycosyltransferase family 1 protein [Virgibacillus necropolis]ASN06000.1 glycosyl transferase family 1 [Virgibacillus necropolis]